MSNVDDHGLEVIKKSAEFVTPGNKSDYYLKVGPTPGFPLEISGSITANPNAPTEVLQFTGSVTTSPTNFPAVAGNDLVDISILSRIQSPSSKRLLFSFDAGVTFSELAPGQSFSWNLNSAISQIQLKSSVDTCDFDLIMNRIL